MGEQETQMQAQGEYMRVKDGYLEVRMRLGKGRVSASGKSMVVATTGGNVMIEGQVNGKPVVLGLNAYVKG